MQDRLAAMEARLAAVEQRLDVLEDRSPAATGYDSAAVEPTLGDGFVSNASTQIGRVLLIFGGAYLLRAITDFQFVPTGIGILMGAAYSMFWLYMAFRRAQIDDQRASAVFYGGTSVVLALPLLVEATTRFALMSGPEAVVALAVYCALALSVALVRDLRSLGWLATGGGIATAIALLIATHSVISVSFFLILLGLCSLWAVYRRQWMGIQWLGAAGANLGVLLLIVLSSSGQWAVDPRVPYMAGFLLLVSYLFSVVFHSHVRGRLVGLFETVQVVVAAGIAFWSAANAVRTGHLDMKFIGMLSLALGVFCYLLALSRNTRTVRNRNFFFYETLGLVFVIAGSALLMPLSWAAAIWALMAVVMAWFSGRAGWVNLSLQCTFLLLAAGIGSGLLATGIQALADSAHQTWPEFLPSHVGIALATVACLFIPVAQRSERWGVMAGLPQLTVLALSVWEVGGLMVAYAAPLLAGVGGPEPNAAILAALRTSVLSVASVALAVSSRHRRWPEARWLVYPVLMLVGIKLFVEDFPNGQPVTLFIALALVGSALLLVARLLKRSDNPEFGN